MWSRILRRGQVLRLVDLEGGGCVAALVQGDADGVLARWDQAGFRGFSTSVVPAHAAAAERSPLP